MLISSTIKKWWPVTYDYGLIKADVSTVTEARTAMYRRENMEIDSRALTGTPEDILHSLEPLSPAPTKELYLTSNFGWTVFFQNCTRGSDPFLAMSQLSRNLGVTAMRICISPAKAFYPSVIWEVYDRPDAGGDEYGYRRSIAAANDGGRWVFEQSGNPFSFENLAAYNSRLKKHRFTEQMLHGYLNEFGIPPLADEVFSGGKNTMNVLLTRPAPAHLPAMTLKEFLASRS